MKALVFGGSGKIGTAVAWDLAQDPDIQEIGIVGRNKNKLIRVKEKIGSPNIKLHILDVNNADKMAKLMKKYDAAAIAVPNRKTSYKVAHCAIENGLNIVDMLEEYHRRPDAYETEGLEVPLDMSLNEYGDWLHQTAIKNNVTFVDGMGFAPGLSNVTIGHAIRSLDKAESAVGRVGGNPSKEAAQNHPLRYMITWAFDHVLREYFVKLFIKKNGKVVEVNAATELESFAFDKLGKNEVLECAITPGMPSFIYSRPELQNFAEKTVRWPGHWQGILALKEIGLLDLSPIKYQNQTIIPRELLLSLLVPKLTPQKGETDVCIMYNTTIGIKNNKKIKIEHWMWDEADREKNFSSMQRVTGFPVAITVKMLLTGAIKKTGIIPPEDAITQEIYPQFLMELKKRNIKILETEKEIA